MNVFSVEALSVAALTANSYVPTAVGIPVISPVKLPSVRPSGKLPDNNDQNTSDVSDTDVSRIHEYS